jgi:UDP-2,3-diacylglucosamine pyrophosphatase LpxH
MRNGWLFSGMGAYEAALALNAWFNRIRRLLGFDYWSFSAWAKLKVKNAVNFISAFESALVSQAQRLGVDGVVCGHTHHARIAEVGPRKDECVRARVDWRQLVVVRRKYRA